MSDLAQIPRRPVHLRRIECTGFAREDGLFDIEGLLTDTRPEPLALAERTVAAHEPIHRMLLRLAVDTKLLIHEAEARTLDAPYESVCGRIGPAYGQLVGLRIEPGFTMQVKRLFRGVQGCTHLTELLPVMATTAFQIVWADSDNFATTPLDHGRPSGSPLGGCHALRLDGEVVLRHFKHLLPDETPVHPTTPRRPA